MKKILIAIVAVLLAMFSCKGNKAAAVADEAAQADSAADTTDTVVLDTLEQLITETQMPQAADELFNDFIFNFAANRKLQRERIAFPLPVVKGETRTTLRASQWETDHFFMHQGFYTLMFGSREQMAMANDTSVSKALVEKIYFAEDRVQQYFFSRIHGVWKLRELRELTLEQHPNASFLDFYDQFATDPDFQAGSLAEAVQFEGPDPDDDFSQMEGIITPDTWPAFAPELPEEMIYNIVYGDQPAPTGTVIFVIRGIANGQELEMTFQQRAGKWVLTKLAT